MLIWIIPNIIYNKKTKGSIWCDTTNLMSELGCDTKWGTETKVGDWSKRSVKFTRWRYLEDAARHYITKFLPDTKKNDWKFVYFWWFFCWFNEKTFRKLEMEIKNKCLFSWEKFSWVKYLVFNSFQRAEKIINFPLIFNWQGLGPLTPT